MGLGLQENKPEVTKVTIAKTAGNFQVYQIYNLLNKVSSKDRKSTTSKVKESNPFLLMNQITKEIEYDFAVPMIVKSYYVTLKTFRLLAVISETSLINLVQKEILMFAFAKLLSCKTYKSLLSLKILPYLP